MRPLLPRIKARLLHDAGRLRKRLSLHDGTVSCPVCGCGNLCFTIPIIHERVSRSREGLPPSHHGKRGETGDDWLVQTEFGADAWTYALRAGFTNVTFRALDYPTAYALIVS
jgi:hypothetical protein